MPAAGHPVPVFDFRLPGVASISADTHKVGELSLRGIYACLGGFVGAFMPAAGHPVPVFDFRLPGVASISADTHKVGELSLRGIYACLGGFVGAFMPAAGHPVPVFDFRLPGVASISADTHKVGELSLRGIYACLGGFVGAFMPAAGHPVPVFDFRLPGVASISADTHKVGELSLRGIYACLGGFVGAFMPAAGHPVPVFDFRLPGVASISADTHKYGYAPKGTSVVLYRKAEYRHCQYTVSTEWPGGVYGSPTVNGSRAGGLIAACWATMMYIGKERYIRMTDEIVTITRYIESELRSVEGIYVFGKPATTVIAWGSDEFDIYKMADLLHKKGWSLNTLQFPSGIHICVTHAHTQPGVAERFVADVRETAAACLKDGDKPVAGRMAIYGVAQSIPDRSLVSDITKFFIDSMYLLPLEE
ncbi:hypothetical protein O0L34_g4512 [Tuta absoluta]|nr:hypothetical protein O0L34_g4512 [Tuta absoluta]